MGVTGVFTPALASDRRIYARLHELNHVVSPWGIKVASHAIDWPHMSADEIRNLGTVDGIKAGG